MSESNQQMTLFTPGGVIDEAINRVLGATITKSGRTRRGMKKRSEIAEAYKSQCGSMTKSDKAAFLDKATLEQRDAAMRLVKAEIAGLGPDWTFHSSTSGTSKKGIREITLKIQEIRRIAPGITDEQYAEGLGISVERVRELRAEAAKKATPTDVPSEVKAPEAAPAEPEPQPEPAPALEEMSDEELEAATAPA